MNKKSMRVAEKCQARVISVDSANKRICLSMQPHIMALESCKEALPLPGKVYNNVKVTKIMFGSSFIVSLNDKLNGFLHKSHVDEIPTDGDATMEDEKAPKFKPKKTPKGTSIFQRRKEEDETLLKVGQVIPTIRVKENNFFDGMPIMSCREDILNADALNYNQVKPGQYFTATVKGPSKDGKGVNLKVNSFVKGIFPIEHMAEMPLRQIPPKFDQADKEVKVRVFSVDENSRSIIFTKKDSFMTEKCELHEGDISTIKKGDKVEGVVVGQTGHGYVVKSFGNVKGLLTFNDIKEQKTAVGPYKEGQMVKTYCLFNKRNSGLALTLSKKKANQTSSNSEGALTFANYLPDSDASKELKESYKSMIKKQNCAELVGKSFTFKIAEEKSTYYVVKAVRDENSSTKIAAIVPKCLAQSCGITLPLSRPDFQCSGIVIEEHNETGLAIVSLKPEIEELVDQIPRAAAALTSGQRLFLGFISEFNSSEGATVRFLNGFTRQIGVKDLVQVNAADKKKPAYQIGQTVRVALNKLDRLSLKQQVIDLADPAQMKTDREIQIRALSKVTQSAMNSFATTVGMRVKATVQMVKKYGLILQVEGSELTGFVVNDQKIKTDKEYKIGQELECIVLDCDTEKKILDLSERLADVKSKKEKVDKSVTQKAFVELSKDNYLVVSLKHDRTKIAACILHPFNQDSTATLLYQKYSVGEEIEVKLLGDSKKGGFLLALPKTVDSNAVKNEKNNTSLEEGFMVSGPLKSIKGHCLYIQVGQQGNQPLIGRLHRVECANTKEFGQFKPGDKIDAKILKVTKEDKKTWIELTRKKDHMADGGKHKDGLDQDSLRLLSFDTMPQGTEIDALIVEVTSNATQNSCPLGIQVSPFVFGQVLFSDCIQLSDLDNGARAETVIKQKYQVGQFIKVIYSDSRFVVSHMIKPASKAYKKGEACVVRFVKSVRSFGITVQLDWKTFGTIELSEITDKVVSNMLGKAQERGLFAARVIDTDKKGRLMLSCRESVVDQTLWKLIAPAGVSAHFQSMDTQRQMEGNMRNKILKFGGKLALKGNDLVQGYVTNISKAGVFVSMGHNLSARVALTELSDNPDFNFQKQMAIGMLVIGRITKVEADGTRFSMSLRRSLVVYGVHQIDRKSLEPMQEFTCIILAKAADAIAFGQFKGSYHKLKIKNVPTSTVEVGSLCQVKLTKVEKDKVVGEFAAISDASNTDAEQAEAEKIATKQHDLVQKTMSTDIAKLLVAQTTDDKTPNEMEAILAASAQKTMPSAYDQQIADLEDLNAADDSDVEMDDDSDAEDMRRIVAETKHYDEDSDADDEEMEDEQSEEVDMEPEILFVYRAKAGGSMFVEIKRPQYVKNEDKSMSVSWFWSKPDQEPEQLTFKSWSGDVRTFKEGALVLSEKDKSFTPRKGNKIELKKALHTGAAVQNVVEQCLAIWPSPTLESEDEEMNSESEGSDSSDAEEEKILKKSGKKALQAQIAQEKKIRDKEAAMREEKGGEALDINDYERLLVADKDQSFLWIQYMAMILDKLDIEAARRIAQRAVKSVSMSNDADKLNIWIAYMNMESQFGTQESLEQVVKSALEVNDRQKVYLQLISIYKQSDKFQYIEEIYKKLCKKYHTSVEIWSSYIEFLFEANEKSTDFTPAKTILQRSLQALPRASHINIISKYGILEFKNKHPESGRTMFEGIVSNYPKRMDIWSIYMDMEVKFGQGNDKQGSNAVQARHLFERCLSLDDIQRKPKKMKLVFRKYMEFEAALGNNKQLDSLRQRVEQYLEKTFKGDDKEEGSAKSESGSGSEESGEESGSEESD